MKGEIFEKVSKCKSVDEVLALAKSNNKKITREQAEKAFEMTREKKNDKLSDEELSNVSGGFSVFDSCSKQGFELIYWKTEKEAEKNFIFKIGQKVEIFVGFMDYTKTYTITERRISHNKTWGYYDEYRVDDDDMYFLTRASFHL